MIKSRYFNQANLLLDLVPFLNKEKDFALKGGSAINFFIRNLDRLSVDIDLTYLPVKDRNFSLIKITSLLLNYEDFISRKIPKCKIVRKQIKGTQLISTLTVFRQDYYVKIETNFVLRGCVFPPQMVELSTEAQTIFQKNVEIQSLSTPDLYAGKICAALDRQHPRDLFDIAILLKNEGITNDIRKAFIVYLLCHSRPIIELLNPHKIDLAQIFENEFSGMTRIEISLQELNKTREELIKIINNSLTENERKFILSFKKKKPQWDLLEFDHIKELPAIKWKLTNLQQMDPAKHKFALDRLAKHLQMDLKEI
jgi:predicted nucleotidyltransferase component of viral defense system